MSFLLYFALGVVVCLVFCKFGKKKGIILSVSIAIVGLLFMNTGYINRVKDMSVNVELSSWVEQPKDAGYIGNYLDYYGVVQTKYEDSKGNYWVTLNNDVIAEIYCVKQYEAIEEGTKVRIRGRCEKAGKQLILLKGVLVDCNCN